MTPSELTEPAAAEPTATTDPQSPEENKPSLLASVEELGSHLVAAELPAPNQVRHWIGALVYYLDHGHTRPPDRPTPGEPLGDARDAQIAALEERLRSLEQGAPVASEPSPVAPAPPAPTEQAPVEPPAEVADPTASPPSSGELA